MRSSFAKQPEFDFSGPDLSSTMETGDSNRLDSAPASGGNSATSRAQFPTFGVTSDLYALASRRAGRLNAASISDKELDDLLVERQLLLDKQFSETITRPETIRLTYVKWQLDRIEDARYGETLDALENWAEKYEQFKSQVEIMQRDLAGLKQKKRK